MLLSGVNPFIRFARPITVKQANRCTVSYDSRMFYVLSGNCTLYVSDKEYRLNPGMLLIWKNAVQYKFSAIDEIQLISVNFDFTQKKLAEKRKDPSCDA